MGVPSEKAERRPSKFGNLSFKKLKKADTNNQLTGEACVLVVGSTGTGKSSTISRYTGSSTAREGAGTKPVTEHCELHRDLKDNLAWVDTVGWEDRFADNQDTFQDILRFISNQGLTQLSAVIWCIAPTIRQDKTVQRQAEFINQFASREIWDNVVIICKQAVNPSQDAAGALRAAQQFNQTSQTRVVGYRYLEDSSLSDEQKVALKNSQDTRKLFNVLTESEVVTLLRETLASLPPPVRVVFRDQRCLDCGEEGDSRLMSPYCHLEPCLKHPGRLKRVHKGGFENYHMTEDQTIFHTGQLQMAWYQFGCMKSGGQRWSCCKKAADAAGCRQVWTCCRRELKDGGCRKRYKCCHKPTDFASGGAGCELVYTCCDAGQEEEGCRTCCVKCGARWGTSAKDCYRPSHKNLVTIGEGENT